MATRSDPPPRFPPRPRRALWSEFLRWGVGVPLVVVAGLGVIWLALWASGGQLFPKTEVDMWTALFWIGAITLMYPVALIFLVGDLRDGLRANRDWEAMGPEARKAALEAQQAAKPKAKQRKCDA